MSALHKAEITAILTRWLQRYSPPASIRGNDQAQQDEAEALLSALLRFVPHTDAGAWARRALDRLEYRMKTRAWPTKAELAEVCSELRKETAPAVADEADMSPAAVAARRMRAGEVVGEDWLYGRNAVEMIAAGLIDREIMQRYRSAAYLRRRDAYGEATARAWEDDAKAQHEAAKLVHRQRNDEAQRRDAGVPDKRATPPDWWAA